MIWGKAFGYTVVSPTILLIHASLSGAFMIQRRPFGTTPSRSESPPCPFVSIVRTRTVKPIAAVLARSMGVAGPSARSQYCRRSTAVQREEAKLAGCTSRAVRFGPLVSAFQREVGAPAHLSRTLFPPLVPSTRVKAEGGR